MTKKILTRDVNFDEDSPYKTQTIEVNAKRIKTPIKSLDFVKIPSSIPFSSKIGGMNEIFRKFTPDQVNSISLDPIKERNLNNELARITKKIPENEIKICFSEFNSNKLPNEKEIEFLTDISYVSSDMTPIPIVPKVIRKDFDEAAFEEYKKFIKMTVEVINQLNHKPILGIIPNISRHFIPELLNIYYGYDINSFFFDFDGTVPTSHATEIRAVLRNLSKLGIIEKNFLYAINVNIGKAIKDENVVPSKDILSFGFGFDCLGNNHCSPRLPKEIWEKIAKQKSVTTNSIRIFNRNDYGYYKLSDTSTIESIYPSDSLISVDLLKNLSKPNNPNEKLFNLEQLGLEAIHIQNLINESEKVVPYLDGKEYVNKNDIKNITSLGKGLK